MEESNRDKAERLITVAQGTYNSNELDILRKIMQWQAATAYAQMAILEKLDEMAERGTR